MGTRSTKHDGAATDEYPHVTIMKGGDESDGALLFHGSESRSNVASASSQNKLTVMTAMVFIVGEVAGSGVLALPKAIENTGWIGIVMLAMCCLAAGWCAVLLGKCWIILEERFPEYQGHCRDPYPSIGFEAFGQVGRLLVSACIAITLFGVSVVFLLLASQNLNGMFSTVPHFNIPGCYWMIILAAVLTPFIWLGTPKDFWPVAVGATVATAVACVFLIAALATDKAAATSKAPVVHNEIALKPFAVAFGTIIFSFGGAPAYPTFQHDMAVPSDFPKAVFWAFFGLTLMYVPVSAVGFFLFGKQLNDNVLTNLDHNWLLYTVEALITAHLLFAFTIVLNPLCQGLEHILRIPIKFTWKRAVLRTLCVIAVLFVAESLPHFGAILALVGGSTSTLLVFVFPCTCYLKLCSKDNLGWPDRHASLHEKVFSVEIIVIGVIGGIASTYSAIDSIAGSNSFVPPCYMNISSANG